MKAPRQRAFGTSRKPFVTGYRLIGLLICLFFVGAMIRSAELKKQR